MENLGSWQIKFKNLFMKIEQVNSQKNGAFVAIEEGEEAGKMTYTWAGTDKFIIDHTEVNPGFEGKGVGRQLLMQVVKFAREKQLKIMPLCPFAKSMFEKMPEINDVRF